MEWISISEENYGQIARIYSEGLDTGIATFETRIPDWEYWDVNHHKFARIALLENNTVVGWGSLAPVSKREVYGGVAEVSVYISKEHWGKAYGKVILNKLIEISEQENIWTLQSGIFKENAASIKLHQKCGFRIIGFRERVAQRNGKWYDNVLMERRSKKIGI